MTRPEAAKRNETVTNSSLGVMHKSQSGRLLAAIAIIAVLHFAAEIVVPFALAILLSFLLSPFADRLEKWRFGRVPSVLLVVLAAAALTGAIAWLVAAQLLDVAEQLPQYRSNIHEKVQALRGMKSSGIGKATQTVHELNQELAEEAAKTDSAGSRNAPQQERPVRVVTVDQTSDAMDTFRRTLGPLVGPVLRVGVVVVFTFFILLDRKEVRNRLLRLAGRKRLNATTRALDDASSRVSRYLLAQFMVNSSYGVAFGVALYFLRVPNALLWGVLAGLMRFIPYLGPLIGAAGPVVLSVAVSPGWAQPLEVTGLFLALEIITANFVEPMLYATHTGIAPLGVVVAALFWTTLWGPLGLILSMPLTVCTLVLGRHIPSLRFISVALGDEPALPLSMQFYQRMLAHDGDEVRSIVNGYLETNQVADLYDVVILPALQLAALDKQNGGLEPGAITFMVDTTRALIEEIERDKKGFPVEAAKSEEATSDQTAPSQSGSQAALECPLVQCLPARDRLDEVGGLMLAHLCRLAGYRAETLSAWAFSGEKLESIANNHAEIVCVIAVSPRSVLYTRGLCKKFRQRFADLKIIAGLCTRSEETSLVHNNVAEAATRVTTKLTDGLAAVRELAMCAPTVAA